ncbi:foldase protein PrsA [Mycoplasma sp. CAG:956]|nr:foldase protein PrsA [Mycoplasma sp. CAG:956]
MNKKIQKVVALSLASMTLLSGCGAKTIPTLENGDQAVVTFNEDAKISVTDFYNQMKDKYGTEVILNMIDKMILEKKYADSTEEAHKNADSVMSQLETSYGDKLLSAIQTYTGYQTLDEYKDYVYLSYLQNKAAEDYAKDNIGEKDIKKYYNDEIKPDIKVSHILISVNYASDASDDDKTKAKNEAKAKAQEALDKLKAADKSKIADTFSELAKEYSNDDSSKNDGGSLGFINTDTLGSNYNNLVTEAYKLKDGEYSSNIVETELGYHLVYRTETKEKAKLEDVRDKIIDALVSDYLSKNQEAYIKSMQAVRKEYGMNIIDDDLNTNYTNYIQNSLLKIQENKKNSSSSN